MRGRWITLPLLVALAQMIAVPSAGASLWLELEPARGVPGASVEAQTLGRQPFPPAASPRSFNLHIEVGDAQVAFGQLEVNREGDGSGKLIVPQVEADTYTVLIDCPPCASYSAGRSILPVGKFEVLTSSQAGNESPVTEDPARFDSRLALLLGIPILLGAWLAKRRRSFAR